MGKGKEEVRGPPLRKGGGSPRWEKEGREEKIFLKGGVRPTRRKEKEPWKREKSPPLCGGGFG